MNWTALCRVWSARRVVHWRDPVATGEKGVVGRYLSRRRRAGRRRTPEAGWGAPATQKLFALCSTRMVDGCLGPGAGGLWAGAVCGSESKSESLTGGPASADSAKRCARVCWPMGRSFARAPITKPECNRDCRDSQNEYSRHGTETTSDAADEKQVSVN